MIEFNDVKNTSRYGDNYKLSFDERVVLEYNRILSQRTHISKKRLATEIMKLKLEVNLHNKSLKKIIYQEKRNGYNADENNLNDYEI